MTVLSASPKATRLLAEQRVMPAGLAALYTVRGDHDTYTVTIGEPGTGVLSCTCPAVAGCSHREAATLLHGVLVAEGLAGVTSQHHSCQRAGLRTGQVATPAGEGSAARAVPAGPPHLGPRRDCPVGHNPPEHPCDWPDCRCFTADGPQR